MMINSSVAVILVNYNSYELTNQCIHTLKSLDYPNTTIIVVDNHSVDNSGQKIQSAHPDIVVLFSTENKGFTGGNNIGFDYALKQGVDYVMMLNNDTLVKRDFLTHLVNYLDKHPDTGAVQPRIHYHHDPALLWNGGNRFNALIGWPHTSGEKKSPKPKHLKVKNMSWITGCAFMVRSSILANIGLLAENMFMYLEDVDLSFRIRQQGYLLTYIPDAIVYHIAGASIKKKKKDKEGIIHPMVHYYNQRNRIWLQKKYSPWYFFPTIFLFNFFYNAMIIGYFVVRKRPRKLMATIHGIKDGLKDSIEFTPNTK